MKYQRIGQLTSVITGGTPSTQIKDYWDGGTIPWLQSGCCQNCEVSEPSNFITEKGLENSSAKIMPKDSVLIALTGATAGKVGFLTFPAAGNQSITGIVPSKEIDQKFLFYYLMSIRNKILNDCNGGAQPHISQNYVKNILFPVLNLADQKKMANELETISNQKKELLEIAKNCDELIKSRFNAMFVGNFPLVRVGDVLETTSGGTPNRSHQEYYANGSIPWLTSGEVNLGIIKSTENSITEEGLKNSSAKMVPENSVVIAMYGATAGKVGLLKIKTATNQAVCSVLPSKRYLPQYLYAAFSSIGEDLASQAAGGAQPNISQGIIKNAKIIDAPMDAQTSFCAFCDSVNKLKFDAQREIDLANELLALKFHQYFDQEA
jgi:type I restriction enzyme S subunit